MRVLVIGAGIAGVFLARALRRRGVTVAVAHDPASAPASKAAAGLVNPVIGIRLTLVPGVGSLLQTAVQLFRELEGDLRRPLWHPLPIDRIFRDAGERARWEKRASDPAYAPWTTTWPEMPVPSPHGGIRITGGGWFDYSALSEVLKAEGVLQREGEVAPGDLLPGTGPSRGELGVWWRGEFYEAAVLCGGYPGPDGWFSGLPWKAARGEILTVRSAVGPVDSVWMRGIFVVPLGADCFRVGSTYRWADFSAGPTEEARGEILQGWREMGLPEPEVVDQKVGIRPILQDRRPVYGRHPVVPSLWILNGLGSRGAMLAPTLAGQLADALVDGAALSPEWEVARFPGVGTFDAV